MRPKGSIIPEVVAQPGGSPAKKGDTATQHGFRSGSEGPSAGTSPSSPWSRAQSRAGGLVEGRVPGFMGGQVEGLAGQSAGGGGDAGGWCNRFAKFTVVTDPAPLWQEAAEQLAEYAAQVRLLLPCFLIEPSPCAPSPPHQHASDTYYFTVSPSTRLTLLR